MRDIEDKTREASTEISRLERKEGNVQVGLALTSQFTLASAITSIVTCLEGVKTGDPRHFLVSAGACVLTGIFLVADIFLAVDLVGTKKEINALKERIEAERNDQHVSR